MMLYLTGSQNAWTDHSDAPQTDPTKSLGGCVSSTPVPNAALNVLFDSISSVTLKDKRNETLALALINKLPDVVKNVTLKIVTSDINIANWKVAAVAIGDDLKMEYIENRYDEPILAEFNDVEFYRASVDVYIKNCGIKDEEISLEPFDKIVTIVEPTYDGFFKAVKEAFSDDEDYTIRRLDERRFRIEYTADTALETPLECSFLTTDTADIEFESDFMNHKNNTAFIIDEFQPEQAIGIWIQRNVSKTEIKDNQEMIDDYDRKVEAVTLEEVELVVDYELSEEQPEDSNNEPIEEEE